MGVFPLPIEPTQSFRSGGVAFGENRGKVEHAGCDLVAPPDTDVLAIADGTIWYGPGVFFTSKSKNAPEPVYLGRSGICEGGVMEVGVETVTYELALITELGVFRYGEIASTMPKGVLVGGKVEAGQPIGKIARQFGASMLHLEWFRESDRRDALTDMTNFHYKYLQRGCCDPPFDPDAEEEDRLTRFRAYARDAARDSRGRDPVVPPRALPNHQGEVGLRFGRRSDLDDPTDLLTALLIKGSALEQALEKYR